jgi:hypothetical protein
LEKPEPSLLLPQTYKYHYDDASYSISIMTEAEQTKVEPDVAQESKVEAPTPAESSISPRQTLDEAHRYMALKQWEKAADQYAVALETL